MTINDFLSVREKHFIAMEYYYVMLNRTFLVLLTNTSLIGLKVSGLIGVEGGQDALTRAITSAMAVKGDVQNPYSYIKSSYAKKYTNTNATTKSVVSLDKANFEIFYSSISTVVFDRRKKWGMGPYPHDGKVLVVTKGGEKREFIILGNQSGERISQDIIKAADL